MICADKCRLRPIMMTALATVAGLLPLASAVVAAFAALQFCCQRRTPRTYGRRRPGPGSRRGGRNLPPAGLAVAYLDKLSLP